MSDLIYTLDKFEHVDWQVDCTEENGYIILESRPTVGIPEDYYMRVYVRKENFKIVAVRSIKRYVLSEDQVLSELGIPHPENTSEVRVVWETKACGIVYSGKMTVIEVKKPGMARYFGQFPILLHCHYRRVDMFLMLIAGFGEQGGSQLLKTKVIIDYFSK